MMKCPKCNQQIGGLVICCPFCGESIHTINELRDNENKVCHKCGIRNKESGNFCKYCGEPLTKEGADILYKREEKLFSDLLWFIKKSKKSSLKDILHNLDNINDEDVDKLHSAAANGRWCGDQRPLCGVSGQDISKAFRRQW